MTIEALLERIAVALEKRNAVLTAPLVVSAADVIAEATKPVPGNTSPAPEAPKNKGGRPRKTTVTEEEKKTATEAEIVSPKSPPDVQKPQPAPADAPPTASTSADKPATVDEIRDLLGKYRTKFHAQDKEGGTSKTQDELEKFTATILRGGVGVRALKDIPAEHFGAVRDYFTKVIA